MTSFPISMSAIFSTLASAKNGLGVAFSRSRSLRRVILRRDQVQLPGSRDGQQSGPARSAFQWPVESKHYRWWKVCRTRNEQPISGGEYSLSGREQFVRQRLYPNVTI